MILLTIISIVQRGTPEIYRFTSTVLTSIQAYPTIFFAHGYRLSELSGTHVIV